MDLALSADQEAVRDAVGRMLAKTSSPERVREAEPRGFSEAVWNGFAEMGIPTMGVPAIGGASIGDLAVVASEAGAALAPAPIVEAMVAHRLLAQFDDPERFPIPVIALRTARAGRFTLVPGGAVATTVVGLDSDWLVPVTTTGGAEPTAIATMGSAALADVELSPFEMVELADGSAARAAFAAALDEWRALTAHWMLGLGRAAFALGLQYVKDRRQFGVPIGTFQAVQHRLADIATDLDGADLIANKAVWALDTDDPTASVLPTMAFTNAGEVVERAASTALHFHGGYGFMEEYDIQLYFRRAKSTRLLLGDPRRELQHLADRLFGPVEPPAPGDR